MITSLVDTWKGLSVRIKVVGTMAGGIAAVAGMITAVPPAWTMMGLPEVATREWVMISVHRPMRVAQETTQKQVLDLQIDVANGKLDQLDNSKAQLEIEKQKTSDEAVKSMVDAQIRKIERDSAAISDQIKTLKNLK